MILHISLIFVDIRDGYSILFYIENNIPEVDF